MVDSPPQPLPHPDPWLVPFLETLEAGGSRVIDLGCGPGLDAAWLIAHDFQVIGCDRSEPALQRARVVAREALLFRGDIGRPLPFPGGITRNVVSSLSLHYFDWQRTRAAFAEVHRILRRDGAFIFRVNASDDVAHGAGQGEELERGFFQEANREWRHAETKRFFDEEMVRAVVAGLFRIEHLAHRTITRYENPKQVWECVARSAGEAREETKS